MKDPSTSTLSDPFSVLIARKVIPAATGEGVVTNIKNFLTYNYQAQYTFDFLNLNGYVTPNFWTYSKTGICVLFL